MDTTVSFVDNEHYIYDNGSKDTTVINVTSGLQNASDKNIETTIYEQTVAIVVPIIFGVITVLGFFGNLLVIIVVATNKQMKNVTYLLIMNLAIADLIFIIICVPFTGYGYVSPTWSFGSTFCKIYQYTINVSVYMSIYT